MNHFLNHCLAHSNHQNGVQPESVGITARALTYFMRISRQLTCIPSYQKLLVLGAMLLTYTNSLAQPLINLNDVFSTNTRIKRSFADNFMGLATPGDSGIGKSWDLSLITPTANDDTLNIMAPSARTWGNNLNGNIITERNLKRVAINWWQKDNQGLKYVGSNVINSFGVYSDYIQSPTRLYLPQTVQYGLTNRDVTTGKVKFFVGQNMGLPFIVDSIDRRIQEKQLIRFDAWGSLTLPGGRVAQVLRQKVTTIYHDTADFKPRGANWLRGADIQTYTKYEYRYWEAGKPYPVAILHCNGDPALVDEVEWSETIRPTTTSLQALKYENLTLAPNPATTQFKVSVNDGARIVSLVLLNQLGQSFTINHDQLSEPMVDVSAIPAGVYTVVVKTDSQLSFTKQLIITH